MSLNLNIGVFVSHAKFAADSAVFSSRLLSFVTSERLFYSKLFAERNNWFGAACILSIFSPLMTNFINFIYNKTRKLNSNNDIVGRQI